MERYRKINNLIGWLVFFIATAVYWLTVEPTASFWDCGEFIAASYRLQVPHPPGAPFFLLVGRMFSFLAMGEVESIAYWVNISSVLSSGFTILFLFWTITLLARKVMGLNIKEETSMENTIAIMGAGFVGALAYTFSDSFWFSAVEAEVYAMSSFFTAFVVWAIFKWETIEDEQQANKWIILIAYMIGLSIGVHLLNLVTIPALALIYYFRKYEYSHKGAIITLATSAGILLIILVGIIPGLPSLAGRFEILFVNSFGLPFGSGIIFFSAIFIGGIVYGVYYSVKKELLWLNMATLSLAFILIGYISYGIIAIRSQYNPPIDQNNPQNIMSFVSYLKREQYGSRPLLYGQYFTAEVVDQQRGEPIYEKGEDRYIIKDYKIDNTYDPDHVGLMPRMWDGRNPNNVKAYQEKAGLRQGEKPSFGDHIKFMITHQMGHMYFRYFMWNFSGRAHDIQGSPYLTLADSDKDLPDALKNNAARNQYYMIPLILGLLGLFYSYRKDKKTFSFVALLFFMTGAAIILYLNAPPLEPRERDYAYVGSFYAFAIWIGFAVLWLNELLSSFLKQRKVAAAVATAICLSAPVIMASENWDDHDRSNRYYSVDSARNFLASCEPNAILFTGGDNDTFPLWYVQDVEGFRTDVRVIVLSYFNTDWYIDQMTRQYYESEPLPFSLERRHYRQGGPNDVLYFEDKTDRSMNIRSYLRRVREESEGIRMRTSADDYIHLIPSRNFFLNIDSAQVFNLGILPEEHKDKFVDRMDFSGKGRVLEKKDLMILDLMVANNWERPIYFNNTSLNSINIDLKDFVVTEGATYRLLPVKRPQEIEELVDTDKMYRNMMERFHTRELDNPDVYYDDNYRGFILNLRTTYLTLAEALFEKNDYERAEKVLVEMFERIPDEAISYDFTIPRTLAMWHTLGHEEKAREIAKVMIERSDDMLQYLRTNDLGRMDVQRNFVIVSEIGRQLEKVGENELAERAEEVFSRHYSSFFN
ncbi:MAG: DUF2723 domain-containing protein [Cyclobacteriaceae bacterium]|nr:DUF2723 domain-containing protein [Cyclobacteriaceae bacterium]MCH8514741.1 DUF2723 domain-containing protein [Cyclobacteriaceae bacterium]